MERRKFILSSATAALAVPAFSALGKNNLSLSDTNTEVGSQYDRNSTGNIVYKDGMPVPFQWFTDDRLSFEIDEMGVTSVIFFNPHTRAGNPFIFRRRLFDGFRLYLEQNHVTYSPKLKNYSFLPFGFSSDWLFNGIVVKYSIYAVQESIVFNLQIPDNAPADIFCKLEFYDSFALTPCDRDDFMFSNWGGDRKWGKWSFDPDVNTLCNGYTEDPSGDITELNKSETIKWHSFLNVCITADFDITHIVREQNVKRILRSQNPLHAGRSCNYIISFIPEEDAVSKTKIKLSGSSNAIEKKIILYREISQQSPVLISPYKELNNFMALAPLFTEVLKVKAIPGAIRSNNILYWVWGWDGMTSNSSLVYWGDTECIRQMLQLYHKSADPVHGIVHAFRNDMTISLFSSTPSQSMYISLLYLYYTSTHDIEEVRKRYGFSVTIFDKILSLEAKQTGFCRGVSLYPDFPKFMKETGNDASLFNNSLFYSAARSLECLAILMDDLQTRDKARAVFTRFEENFLPKFFNDDKNFFVSSIDTGTMEQRDSYNLGAVKWDMGFFADLVDPVSRKAMDFIDKNLISNVALREVPLWNESFDGDGNQLHCWFTANAQYFIRTANENNRADLLDKFRGWVEYWTSQLTCPEAINYYAENSKPERERWNSMPGVWQMFGIKEWYLSVIHGIVGIDAGPGGITFYPNSGEEMKLLGFNHMGKQFDIELKGSGKYISEINVDGVKYTGTNILPVDAYENIDNKHIKLSVLRTSQMQWATYIKSGYGIELKNYSCQKGKIKATLGGLGTCNLKIYSETDPVVSLDGVQVPVKYYPDLHLAILKVVFEKNQKKELEIIIHR
jgi:hypothetical protein